MVVAHRISAEWVPSNRRGAAGGGGVVMNASTRSGRHKKKEGGRYSPSPNTVDSGTNSDTIRGWPKLNRATLARDPAKCVDQAVQSPSGSRYIYVMKKLLQKAIYGAVFMVNCYRPDENCEFVEVRALKVMVKALGGNGDFQEDIFAEVKFAKYFKGHPNLVSYFDIWETNEHLCIIMEFAHHADLFEVVSKREFPFTEREARSIFKQILSAADYLHHLGVAFRDYSTENVLMFRAPDGLSLIPKITDPGQAIKVKYNTKGQVRAVETTKLFGKSFRPPELYKQGNYYNPLKVDSFCIGWMLFYCLTRRQLFDHAVDTDSKWRLFTSGRLNELLALHDTKHLSVTLLDLLIRLLHPDFESFRYTPAQALNHPWFKGEQKNVTLLSDARARRSTGTIKLQRPILVKGGGRTIPLPVSVGQTTTTGKHRTSRVES